MNIKEAKQEIINSVRAYLSKDEQGNYMIPSVRQRPVLLMGPPGIGKTQIMEQIAEECHIGLVAYNITHHTRQSAVGLPFIRQAEYEGKEYSVTEYTMSEIIASIYEKMRETEIKEGILFIDEINCVSETLSPTMLQLLQGKTFGNQAVPQGWIIVAAGNPPEYNKSVRDFDMVTLDRVRRIDITADYSVWKEYARGQGIHGALISYLELRPKNFYRAEADVDGLQFVTARGWEDLSCLMKVYETQGISVDEEIVYEFLRHHDVAGDVAAYIDLYQKYQDDYGIEHILQGVVSKDIYARLLRAPFDERVSVVNLLLDGIFLILHRAVVEKDKTDRWYDYLKQYQHKLKEEQDSGKEIDAKAVFEDAKADFDEQKKTLECREREGLEALEHAFDFMEDAFGNGQEMILFVTELTVWSESAVFLAGHTCERYLKYSQELLVGTRRRELLKQIEE